MNGFIVFAGPSIDRASASEIAPLEYRPPAAQGDVVRAVWSGARAIGLIDGYFESVPAVWHKEILFALQSGVHVFGAASMGALRAAELDAFGMRGVGEIYKWYASGKIDADDEVALVHGPAEVDFLPLSEPLVNVRATLESAVSSSVLALEQADLLLATATRIYYKRRTWPEIFAEATLAGAEAEHFSGWLRENKVDQKRTDAEALLREMVVLAESWPGPFLPGFAFEPTDAWNLGVEEFKASTDVAEIDKLVLDEARLDPDLFRQLVDAAALNLAGLRKGATRRPRSRGTIDAFRVERGLIAQAAFSDWLRENNLDEAELDQRLAARRRIEEAFEQGGSALLQEIVGEIKVRGLYAPLARRAADKADVLSTEKAAGRIRRQPIYLLLEWFYAERLGRPVPTDLDRVCRSLVLADRSALQELLAREFAFATLGN